MPPPGQIWWRLIRPAGCTLTGTVNVSSPLLAFLCPSDRVSNATAWHAWFALVKGRSHARFSRCKGHGADPARLPDCQNGHHQPQREPGVGLKNVRRRRLEHAVGANPG